MVSSTKPVFLAAFFLALTIALPLVHAQTLKIYNVKNPNQVVADSLEERYRVTASIDWQTGSDHYLWVGLARNLTICTHTTNGCLGVEGHVTASPQPCYRVFPFSHSFSGMPNNPDYSYAGCVVNLPGIGSGTEEVAFDFVTFGNNMSVGSVTLYIWAALSPSSQQTVASPSQGQDAYNITLQAVAAALTTTSINTQTPLPPTTTQHVTVIVPTATGNLAFSLQVVVGILAVIVLTGVGIIVILTLRGRKNSRRRTKRRRRS